MFDSRRLHAPLAAFALTLAMISAPAQITANGYIDSAFSPACFPAPADFTTRALLVQGDGKILAGGNYSIAVGACRNGLVRLRADGVVDGTVGALFNPNDFVTSIATQSNGKSIVGGRLTDGLASPVVRLNANGSRDGTFARINDASFVANAVAIQSDNKIVVAGVLNAAAGFVFRLNADGTLDNAFTTDGTTDLGVVGLGITSVALRGSKILVGGSFTYYDDGVVISNRSGLALLNDDGTLDKTFRAPLTNADVRAILVQPDGKILVAGRFATHGGDDRALTRLNADGTRDSSFSAVGIGITGLALALEPNGKILLGHHLGVIRVNTNGVVDETFGPGNADGPHGTRANFASALARTPDGNVLVGAASLTDGTTVRRGVIRLFGNIPPPPIITQFSTNQINVDAGTNVTLSVMATGAPPITFQWRKNGLKLNGATSSNLTLVDVDSTDFGDYRVVVTNPGGSVTSAVVRLNVIFFLSPITVTVTPIGGGTVSPNFQGRALEIGRTYVLTARPAKGFLFTNWSGFETSSNPVLTFVMQSNEVLQANFVPSPFIPVRGAYAGLFFDSVSPAHENAGDFNLTLDDKGGFRGTVRMGTKPRKFSGTFSLDRVATVNLPATTTQPFLSLSLELDTVNGLINGGVTIGNNVSPSALFAFRKVFSSSLNPAPNSGLFNAALPGEDDLAGDGFVPLTVTTAGRVSGRGALADGTLWNVVSATSPNALVPIYVPLYGGAGSIFGWLTVTNTGSNDVAGTLWWTKSGGLRGAIHQTGVTNQIEAIGSVFTPVLKGTPVLNLPAGVAILSGGNLVDSLTNVIALGGDNRIVGDNALSLSLSTTKGALTGSFVDPATSRKRTVKGVALQNQNQARGFFLGTDESGRVFVGE